MIGALVGALVLLVLHMARRARARRQSAIRFGELVGVRPLPGESTEEIIARAADRFRIR